MSGTSRVSPSFDICAPLGLLPANLDREVTGQDFAWHQHPDWTCLRQRRPVRFADHLDSLGRSSWLIPAVLGSASRRNQPWCTT